jgi:hypothetical protein
MNKLALVFGLGMLQVAAVFAAGNDSPADDAADAPVDATVQLEGGSVAIGVGYVWGHGHISFQGGDHPFSVSGVSVADVGVANISATGTVSHLSNLSDFSGNYVAVGAGVTVGGGGSATYLRNEHGVIIRLAATDVGLRFNLSANGVRIQLK